MIVLKEEEIKKLLAKPKNRQFLDKAIEHQKELEQFYENAYPELVLAQVKPLLTDRKFKKFCIVSQNHSQSITDRADKHYAKVYSANGKVIDISFGENLNLRDAFIDVTETLYEGQSIDEFARNQGHKLALTQPNSVFLVGNEDKIRVVHIPLKDERKKIEIWDIEASNTGIRYCIIKEQKVIMQGETKKTLNQFWVYDDRNWSVWLQERGGFFLDPDYGMKPHGNSVCPITFAYNSKLKSTNQIQTESIYSDSLKNMYEYNILRTMYQNYKYFGAFGKDVRSQVRCNYTDENNNVMCNGSGILAAINPANPSVFPTQSGVASTRCPDCQDRDPDMGGGSIEIPINQQGNEAFISNLTSMNFRIEADSSILVVHREDIDSLKHEMLVDIIGQGFTDSGIQRRQAVNELQVRSNLDDQQTNLTYFAERREDFAEFTLMRAAELFTKTPANIKYKYGRKFFLKSTDQLIKELESYYKGTNNNALIEDKLLEILMTDNKNDHRILWKWQIIRILKPYSSFPLSYVENNREQLPQKKVARFDNFDQALALFEIRNGPLESFMFDEFNKDVAINNISNEFELIFNEIL